MIREMINPEKVLNIPFRAMTFEAGFMIAESADIGLLVGLLGSAKSTITT